MPPQTLTRDTRIKEMHLDISENNQLTDAVDLKGYGLIGLIIEPLETANGNVIIYPYVSADGASGTYRPLYDSAGNQFTLTVPPATALAISADYLAPLSAYRWVKLRLNVPQTGDLLFIWVLKG